MVNGWLRLSIKWIYVSVDWLIKWIILIALLPVVVVVCIPYSLYWRVLVPYISEPINIECINLFYHNFVFSSVFYPLPTALDKNKTVTFLIMDSDLNLNYFINSITIPSSPGALLLFILCNAIYIFNRKAWDIHATLVKYSLEVFSLLQFFVCVFVPIKYSLLFRLYLLNFYLVFEFMYPVQP